MYAKSDLFKHQVPCPSCFCPCGKIFCELKNICIRIKQVLQYSAIPTSTAHHTIACGKTAPRNSKTKIITHFYSFAYRNVNILIPVQERVNINIFLVLSFSIAHMLPTFTPSHLHISLEECCLHESET